MVNWLMIIRALQAYGMATWDCFRKPREQGGLQLQTMVKLAEGVAGKNHGFRSGSLLLKHSAKLHAPPCACVCYSCRRLFND